MEFPALGDHCTVKTCNVLDFLPMKCDACSNIFCKDHFSYSFHSCNNALQKDVQVPVCPLCNKPVPSKRGEQPDIAVSEHIDRDCQADPAISKRKIYTNKCCVKGCKQKEVIRITCDVCLKSYCLKHRHPDDHKCQEQRTIPPTQAAGAAAIARAQQQSSHRFKFPWESKGTLGSCASSIEKRHNVTNPMPEVSITSVQGRLSEDEALALALQNSMKETKPKHMEDSVTIFRLQDDHGNYHHWKVTLEKIIWIPVGSECLTDNYIEKICRVNNKEWCMCIMEHKTRMIETRMIELCCKRTFHESCIVSWLKEYTECPVCDRDVIVKSTSHIKKCSRGGRQIACPSSCKF